MKPNVRESLGLNQPNFGRRLRNIALTGAALIGAVVAVSGLVAPVVRPFAKVAIVNTLDSTYVFQQSYSRHALSDSLKHDRELERIDARLAVVDTIKMCLRRKKPDFCE